MNKVNKIGLSLQHQATKVKNRGRIRFDLPKYLIIRSLTLMENK